VGVLAAGVGLVTAATGQAVVARWAYDAHGPRPTWLDRGLGLLLSASLLGALMFVASATSLFMARARRRGHPPRLALYVVTLLGTLALSVHVFAVGLHVLLGSHLTSSGLAFFLNSKEHIANAVTRQYLGYLVPLVALCGVLARGLGWMVKRAMLTNPARVGLGQVGGCLAMTGVAAFAASAPAQHPVGVGVARTSPEMAILASVSSAGSVDEAAITASPLVQTALASPRSDEMAVWDQTAPLMGERPNVVLVLLESVSTRHVGFMGYPRPTTPNLDRIASRSLRMTRAYSTATHSSYAQMAVLSSLFPRRGTSLDMYHRLDYRRVLLHDLTSRLGYATATTSSQDETWQGMRRFQDTGTPTYFHHAPDHQGEHLDLVTEEVAPDDATIDHALAWIDGRKGASFSIYVNLQSTHFPYPIPRSAPRPFQPSEPQGTFNYVRWDRGELDVIVNRYDNALAYVDGEVGRLYDGLMKRGLLEDTIFVVTADHGELFFDHDTVTHGRTLYEGEARVPLLVHYPNAIDPGDDATPVSTLDVLPTIVDLMELVPHPTLQGKSFAHARHDASRAGAPAVYMNIQGWKHLQAIVCFPYKLVYDPDLSTAMLYDLEADPNESRDLVAERPAVAEALQKTLLAQLDAQDLYHAAGDTGRRLRSERAAPRLLPCPGVP
jgi:arylsulfatase A-like enzyme